MVASAETTAEYLRSLHQGIDRKSYRFTDGLPLVCGLVADHLMKRLQTEGKDAFKVEIVGELNNRGGRRNLNPKPYPNHIRWGAHFVAHTDGVVYDPSFCKPLPWNEYVTQMFRQTIEVDFGNGGKGMFFYEQFNVKKPLKNAITRASTCLWG